MRVSWLTWFWPITILLLSASAILITFVPAISSASIASLIRPIIIIAFLFTCPGMAVTPFFRLGETVIELMIGFALSFTIDSFVAGILLYTHHWSIVHILALLLGISLGGALFQLIIASIPWIASWQKKAHPQPKLLQVEAKNIS